MKKTMFEILNKYGHTGHFDFHVDDDLGILVDLVKKRMA